MSFKEHNNRIKAKNFAEYITGEELRKYVASKVKKYVGENPTIFDGALGSGQLEQYCNPEKIYGVEIQAESCEAAKENYSEIDIENKSFFNFTRDNFVADCVIMNPPFSIKFKDLSEEEQENIRNEFSWKKSGVVDDIFVLKSLKYTKKYGFYILFPGVGYRSSEKKFREIIGNSLQELNMIENAFEDTGISVLFIVIDKEKTDNKVTKELYDCKTKSLLKIEETDLEEDFRWQPTQLEKETEEINIEELKDDLKRSFLGHIENSLDLELFLFRTLGEGEFLSYLAAIKEIVRKYERKYLIGDEE
ncbi:N-6 DNA methylase [Pseudoleptotrichia goodfellowii]|uniref:DNA methylase adenine-specific domain-containing protein n=1 Tax=Pseudoleptotrichia goodfellowii TaxID=157692 RepID=A0A510JBB8_9FUSO|nr:N-6 DNA methylase [Pseudoleptotrichia goodfellowii]BBM35423.1 hypothetical protein JCM16774_0336 [Pseudoleptotrichia goodfellowii]